MTATVDYHVEGVPEVRAMLAAFQGRELQNRMRKVVRAGAQPFRPALSAAAASDAGGNVPASFTKVGPPKVTTRGGDSGREIQAYVRPKSPLFNIFQPGAGPHQIAPGHAYHERMRIPKGYQGAGRWVRGRLLRIGGGRSGGRPVLIGPRGSTSWDPKGRKRGAKFFSAKTVTHPGMKPRDILTPAFAAGLPAAQEAIVAALFTNTAIGQRGGSFR